MEQVCVCGGGEFCTTKTFCKTFRQARKAVCKAHERERRLSWEARKAAALNILFASEIGLAPIPETGGTYFFLRFFTFSEKNALLVHTNCT